MTFRRITSLAAWKGPEVDYRREMIRRFTDAELREVDAALTHCGARDVPEITPDSFPLPGLGPALRRMRDRLLTGNGVLLLRGLDRAGHTDDDLARIYIGLGTHLGVPVAQSFQGELLGSIIDVSDIRETIRGYNFGGGQNFHTDGTATDIVSLMCLRPARSGGASRIVSAAALHNTLLDTRPDLLDALYEGYIYRWGTYDAEGIPAPIQTAACIPVFAPHGDGICVVQETSHIRNAVREGGITLTERQAEAFAALQQMAKNEDYFLDMDFEAGDIQFLNNRVILHGRTDYEDAPDVAHRRYLLRLWLNMPDWPARPANQMFNNPEVVRTWLRRRRPGMDLPTRYLEEAAAMQRQRQAEATVLPRVKGALQPGEWLGAARQ